MGNVCFDDHFIFVPFIFLNYRSSSGDSGLLKSSPETKAKSYSSSQHQSNSLESNQEETIFKKVTYVKNKNRHRGSNSRQV